MARHQKGTDPEVPERARPASPPGRPLRFGPAGTLEHYGAHDGGEIIRAVPRPGRDLAEPRRVQAWTFCRLCSQALRRIEAGLANGHRRREILDRDLGDLKQRLAVLQGGVENFERDLGR